MQPNLLTVRTDTLRWVVCDIEGTLSPIDFVRQTLFPYARARFATWLQTHADQLEVKQWWAQMTAQEPGATSLTAVVQLLMQWSDQDLKIGLLKTLQGWMWADGYADGSLRAPLYPDVLPAFARWQQAGLQLAIYSSGSVVAQQLFFAHSSEGDVRSYIQHWFDTSAGNKLAASSYLRIAQLLDAAPAHLLFVSDHPGEVDAARQAGWQAVQITRAPQPLANTIHDLQAVG